jgi:hypothetical protein
MTQKSVQKLIFLAILAEFDKAEQLYQVLLNQTTDDRLKPDLYQMLGSIKDD